jgi:hypothetical protein
MTKTSFDPKISYITPSNASSPVSEKDKSAFKSSDAFVTAKKSKYQTLLSGNHPKGDSIDPGVINEMQNAEQQVAAAPVSAYEQTQYLIGGLMVGEVLEKYPMDYLDNIPNVPNIKDIVSETSAFHDNNEPIVQRYAALEKVIVAMYSENNRALAPQLMCQYTAPELRALQAYRGKLDETLSYCREQLGLAKGYLRNQIERQEKAAADAAAEAAAEAAEQAAEDASI